MYQYDEIDQRIVDERVSQFRDQMDRFLRGELSEDDFRPLRLQNGLYIQRHAPMLRIAIPYGVLSSRQLRQLAYIARHYDRGIGHFSTRQNIQFNWPELHTVPDILGLLAEVQMHAIQTSGNCVRNTTSDEFAGVAHDEIVDPRPYCELIRQWSTFHPEFAYLPRKFKIAVNGATHDRAATGVHDIGLHLRLNSEQKVVIDVWVGGGLGRTPMVGHCIYQDLPEEDLLSYLDAILRVYNEQGRRDNKYKARIKILVKALTPAVFAEAVREVWEPSKDGAVRLDLKELDRIRKRFIFPVYEVGLDDQRDSLKKTYGHETGFLRWLRRNVVQHRVNGYASVVLSLKAHGRVPGDLSDTQMERVADLADLYSFSELRVTHEQNLVFPHVHQDELWDLYNSLKPLELATPNIGLLTNIISCPGGDYCSLANARSIPVAAAIQERFDALDRLEDIGPLDLNISGCMNSCGHHHVGHIGILGVDKHGSEYYQISIGGQQYPAHLGKVIGPSLDMNSVPDAIESIINTYLDLRLDDEEPFIEAVHRLGIEPFKEQVYATTVA